MSVKEFQKAFDAFGAIVTDKVSKYGSSYSKLPYSKWLEVKTKFLGKNVIAEYEEYTDSVTIRTTDRHEVYFDACDDSFGSYLLHNYICHVAEIYNEKKEIKEEMKGFNFDFGPCTKDNVRMSMYGLAVQNNAGVWVSYNEKNGELIDVDVLNFDGRQYMFKMPVAIKDIKKGDIIVHNRIPMFVLGTDEGIVAVDPRAGEEKKIIPTTNMFGFNFVTKVVSMFDAVGSAPTPDSPFGNMLPLMLMTDDNKLDPAMLMLMMNSNGGASAGFDMSNPMMLYFLMSKDSGSDMLPLVMMMNMNQKPTHKCNCGNHHE